MIQLTIRLFWIAAVLLSVSGMARSEPVTPEHFGLHLHKLSLVDSLGKVRFGFLRLWDTGTTWAQLEPKRAMWNFNSLDDFVRTAQKHDAKILYTLGMTPAWAAQNPNAESHYFVGASSPPFNINDWRVYVRTLATRYKGRIRYWELWNEVDDTLFYSGDLKTLVALEKAASEELKSIDPENTLLSANLQGGAFRKLDQYFAEGGGRYADGIAYHFYALNEEPEEVLNRITKVREVMRKHGLAAKHLWNTEFGWLLANQDGAFGKDMKPAWQMWRKVNYAESPGVVMRALMMGLAGGVKSSFWYAWDNTALGLSEAGVPKQAAIGFNRLQEWVVGSEFKGCELKSDVWRCRLSRRGLDSWVVWSQAKQVFQIPDDWRVDRIQRYVAAPMSINERTVVTGPIPFCLMP